MKRVVAIACSLLVVACAAGDDVSGDSRVVDDTTMTFSVTPARVEVGTAVRFAFRVSNHSGQVLELTFPSSKRYDFWVTQDGEEVWRWSDGMVFTQGVTTQDVASQDAVVLTENWVPTEPGSFVAHGAVEAERYDRPMTGEVTVGS